MNSNKLMLIVLIISAVIQGAYSYTYELDIDRIYQPSGYNNWCWAASCEMVMEFMTDEEYSQYDIADWCVDRNDEKNYLSGEYYPGEPSYHTVKEYYDDEGGIDGEYKEYSLTDDPWEDFWETISNGHPVHAVIKTPFKHMVVFYYAEENSSGDKILKWRDPDPSMDDDKCKMDNMYDRTNYVKSAFLVEGVGVDDELDIVECPGYVESDDSPVFKCQWRDYSEESWITEWKWAVYFYHYESGSNNSQHTTNNLEEENLHKSGEISWNPDIPLSLPSDKEWIGVKEGQDIYVKGRFWIWVKDSDGYTHADYKSLWFKNPPGVSLYEENGTLISSYSTETISGPGQDLTFYGTKHGAPADSWNWKLLFPHRNGEAVVASNTSTYGSWGDTWEIEDFTLPEGYDWVHNSDGYIQGRVELEVEDGDNDGFNSATYDVVYIPQELYPDYVLFKDETVTQHNLEVKSHYTTEVRNVSFPSNYWNNKVMSGENLILDGSVGDVTVEANTGVEFIVDPALK